MASAVWRHFTIDSESSDLTSNYATCNICSKRISRGVSKSTSNLKKHLSNQHHIDVNKLTGTTKQSTTAKTSFKTPGLGSFFKPVDQASTSSDPVSSLFVVTDEERYDDPLSSCESVLTVSKPHLNPTSPSTSSDSGSLSPITSLSPQHYPKFRKPPVHKPHNQPTLGQLYEKISKFKQNDPRQVKTTRLIAEMVCLDIQPLNLVENLGFYRLISYLEPRYQMVSRKTLGNKIIPDMYESVKASVIEELESIKYVSVTTDMWTSISGVDYMALTCHYYRETRTEVVLAHKCLEVIPFKEISHTAVNLKKFLCEVLAEWKIDRKVVAIVRDNGRDITAAVNFSNYPAVPCTAHTLQLVIKGSLDSNLKVSNLIGKCKRIVGSFKHSSKNTKILRRCQKQLGIKEHRMIQDEPTRWNSTYHMMNRLVEQKNAIILASSNNDCKIAAELTSEEWKGLEYVVQILDIFETATLQLSNEASTISEIIPIIKVIINHLESPAEPGSGLQGFKNDLLTNVKVRFGAMELELDNLLGPATFLDPRFKTTPFSSDAVVKSVKEIILNEMKADSIDSPDDSPCATTSASSTVTSQSTSSEKGLWAKYKTLFASETSASLTDAEEELEQYLSQVPINPSSNSEEVGRYWVKSPYARLKKLSFKYLCVPPATVFSERLFSTAGNINDVKRNRLDPERVKMLVFLNKNLK